MSSCLLFSRFRSFRVFASKSRKTRCPGRTACMGSNKRANDWGTARRMMRLRGCSADAEQAQQRFGGPEEGDADEDEERAIDALGVVDLGHQVGGGDVDGDAGGEGEGRVQR